MIGVALLTSRGSERDFRSASLISNMNEPLRTRNSIPSDFPRVEMCWSAFQKFQMAATRSHDLDLAMRTSWIGMDVIIV